LDRNHLKRALDALYDDFDFEERARHDPIRVPMKYKREADVEAAAFIASSFAYGRVDLFVPGVEKILSLMGKSPHGFLLEFDVRRQGRLFQGIRYRFNRTEDILCLLHAISVVLKKYGSLQKLFKRFYNRDDADTGGALAGMVAEMLSVDTSPVYGKDVRPGGFRQFLPSPRTGGACKRANLFLRWMVRDRDIDFGIWKGIGKDRLVIPLDTHIARVSRCLGLTARKSADWKAAVEITAALRRLDPEDPLRYDFALCHRGIEGLCGRQGCERCALKGHSLHGKP
jgi:uncharacterized protein (TIGR02757 family)